MGGGRSASDRCRSRHFSGGWHAIRASRSVPSNMRSPGASPSTACSSRIADPGSRLWRQTHARLAIGEVQDHHGDPHAEPAGSIDSPHARWARAGIHGCLDMAHAHETPGILAR